MDNNSEKQMACAAGKRDDAQCSLPFSIDNQSSIMNAETYEVLAGLIPHHVFLRLLCVGIKSTPFTTFCDMDTREEDMNGCEPHHQKPRRVLVHLTKPENTRFYLNDCHHLPPQSTFQTRRTGKIEAERPTAGSAVMDGTSKERGEEAAEQGRGVVERQNHANADTQLHHDAATSFSTRSPVCEDNTQFDEDISLPSQNVHVRFIHPMRREYPPNDLDGGIAEQLHQVLNLRQGADVRSWLLSSYEPELIRIDHAREMSVVDVRVWMRTHIALPLDRDESCNDADTERIPRLKDHSSEADLGSGTGLCQSTVPETLTQSSEVDQWELENIGRRRGLRKKMEGDANANRLYAFQEYTTNKLGNEVVAFANDKDLVLAAPEARRASRAPSVLTSKALAIDEHGDMSARQFTTHDSRSRYPHREYPGLMTDAFSHDLDKQDRSMYRFHVDAEEGWDARVRKDQVPYDRGEGSPSPTRKMQNLRAIARRVGLGVEECADGFW